MWNDAAAEAIPFTWERAKLLRAEWTFLAEAGKNAGAAGGLPPREQAELAVDVLARDAGATLELEGEIVDAERVKSRVRDHMGLSFGGGGSGVMDGVALISVDVAHNAGRTLTAGTLSGWSGLLGGGPVSEAGRDELRAFLRWFERETTREDAAAAPITLAGLAHLWFESIHPFSFGTGVVGRAIAQKTLMRGMPGNYFAPLSVVLLRRQKEYYAALDRACRERDASSWLLWFAAAAVEAGRENRAGVVFAKRFSALMKSLRDHINGRQEDMVRRMFSRESDALPGEMRPVKYAKLCRVPLETAERELDELASLEALRRDDRDGEAIYRPAVSMQAVEAVRVEDIA